MARLYLTMKVIENQKLEDDIEELKILLEEIFIIVVKVTQNWRKWSLLKLLKSEHDPSFYYLIKSL